MALIYTFGFDSRYVGYEATITDADGAEVAGSPVTLDANGDGPLRFNISARQGGTYTGGTGFSTAAATTDIEGFITYQSDTGAPPQSLWNDYKIPQGASGTVFAIDAPVGSNSSVSASNTANHLVTISATVDAHGYDEAGEATVTDGVYEAVMVIWITKSDLPTLPV